MHCAICDKDDDSVTAFNRDCPECQEVIRDTLASYDLEDEPIDEDNPVMETEFVMFEDKEYLHYGT